MNRQLMNRCLLFLATLFFSLHLFAKGLAPIGIIPVEDLPREGRQTLELIKRGGPFSYPNDGRVFRNFEGVLPKQKREYYHEFTVKTPGARNRGARRIVSGGDPQSSGEYYYSDDHYETFRRIKE